MNRKFYDLPLKKQNRIINAGFEAFSQTDYKKTSMLDISQKAGISKSLLFYYFQNKKEFYLFLCDFGIKYVWDRVEKININSIKDFFEIYHMASHEKCMMFKEYPHIQKFLLKAYLEEEPVQQETKTFKKKIYEETKQYILNRIDKSKFKHEEDISMIVNLTNWVSEGFMRENIDSFEENIDDLEFKYLKILNMLKRNFYKEEYANEQCDRS